jgi:hypothetical protein
MRLVDFLNKHLIDCWRSALRLRIIQLHTFITLLVGALYNLAKSYPTLAQDAISKLPPTLMKPTVVNLVLLVWLLVGAYARLVPQPNLPPPQEPKP